MHTANRCVKYASWHCLFYLLRVTEVYNGKNDEDSQRRCRRRRRHRCCYCSQFVLLRETHKPEWKKIKIEHKPKPTQLKQSCISQTTLAEWLEFADSVIEPIQADWLLKLWIWLTCVWVCEWFSNDPRKNGPLQTIAYSIISVSKMVLYDSLSTILFLLHTIHSYVFVVG